MGKLSHWGGQSLHQGHHEYTEELIHRRARREIWISNKQQIHFCICNTQAIFGTCFLPPKIFMMYMKLCLIRSPEFYLAALVGMDPWAVRSLGRDVLKMKSTHPWIDIQGTMWNSEKWPNETEQEEDKGMVWVMHNQNLYVPTNWKVHSHTNTLQREEGTWNDWTVQQQEREGSSRGEGQRDLACVQSFQGRDCAQKEQSSSKKWWSIGGASLSK